MKIIYDQRLVSPFHAIVCEMSNCPYQRECANHASAGDFRSEGGLVPELSMKNGEVHCDTIMRPSDESIDYACLPENYSNIGPSLCWKDIREVVNDYHI